MNLASLGIVIDSSQAQTAASRLGTLAAAGGKTETALGRLARTAREFGAGLRQGAAEALREYSAGADKAAAASARAAKEMQGISRAAQSQQKAMGGIGDSVLRYSSILAAGFGLGAAVKAADQWGQVNARLKIATAGTDDYVMVQEELSRIADLTYSSFGNLASAYANSTRNMRELGLTTRDQLKVQEAMLSASIVSGANDEARARGMQAFNKALAQGNLGGEEFQTITETSARVVGLLAKEMKTTEGAVANLARNGGISVDKLLRALINGAGQVSKEVEDMPVSFADGMVRLGNAFQRYIGRLDEATGISKAATGAMDYMARNFDDVVRAATVLATLTLPLLISRFVALGVVIAANPLGAIATAAVAATAAVTLYADEITIAANSQTNLADLAGVAWAEVKTLAGNAIDFVRDQWAQFAGVVGETKFEFSISDAVVGVGKGLDFLVNGVHGTVAAIQALFVTLGSNIAANFRASINAILSDMESLINKAIGAINALGGSLKEVSLGGGSSSAALADPLAAMKRAMQASLGDKTFENATRDFVARADKAAAARNAAAKKVAESGDVGKSNIKVPGDPKEAAKAAKAAAEQIEKLRGAKLTSATADIQRSLRDSTTSYENMTSRLEALRSAGLVDETEYYQKRRELVEGDARVRVQALDEEIKLLGLTAMAQKANIANQKDPADRKKAQGDYEVDDLRRQSEIADKAAERQRILDKTAVTVANLGTSEKASADATLRSQAQARLGAEDYLNTLREQNDAHLNSIGLGEKERERIAARAQIIDRYQQQETDLQREMAGARDQAQRDSITFQLGLVKQFRVKALQEWDAYWLALQEKQLSATTGARDAIADYISASQDMAGQTRALFSNAFTGMEDALVNFVKTGKLSFRDLVDSIIADITRMLARKAIGSFLMGLTGMGAGGSAAYSAAGNAAIAAQVFARGGAFDSGGVRKFAAGGVVHKPTTFAFANGTGLMGEAGPEAIMPLKRGRNGNLGVEGGGGGATTVEQINIQLPETSSQPSQMEVRRMINEAVRSAMSGVERRR